MALNTSLYVDNYLEYNLAFFCTRLNLPNSCAWGATVKPGVCKHPAETAALDLSSQLRKEAKEHNSSIYYINVSKVTIRLNTLRFFIILRGFTKCAQYQLSSITQAIQPEMQGNNFLERHRQRRRNTQSSN